MSNYVSGELPNVSILTAAHEPDPQYLLDAYDALDSQGVDWQWVLQIDGDTTRQIPREIIADNRVDIAMNGEHLGVATTRNIGLLRCDYELAQNLDADDVLYPNAIHDLANAIRPEGVAFAFGESHHFFADPGRNTEHWQPAPWEPGTIKAGTIPRQWNETGRHHVSLSATLWKTIYIHAYGGWGALRGMQDVYLMLAVSEDYDGAYVGKPVLRSRIHDSQNTNKDALLGEREQRHRALVASRLHATRILRGMVDADNLDDPSYFDPHTQNRKPLPNKITLL